MTKHKMAWAVSAVAVVSGLGTFGTTRVWADGCPTAESLAVAGQVSNEAELRYAIKTADIAEVAVATDFAISCTNIGGDETYITKDFTIDLNGKKITANTPWALDLEGEEASGKTLTIKDTSNSGGAFEFDDAGIWIADGANLTIDSGGIIGTGGRGRGVSVQGGGKFTMNNGTVSGAPASYVKDGATYWYNLVLILGETSSAEINGGEIVVNSGDGRAFYSSGANTEMTNGAVSSAGGYAVEVDQAVFTMGNGSISGKDFGVVLFEGAEFVMNGGTVEADSIAISGNGTSTGDKITIGGGTIRAGELGIYAPQIEGVTTMTSGDIEAKTGIEIRAGTLNITGGTIASTADSYSVTPNGNGSTTVGAAVAIAQHTTKQPINVTISGGSFSGPKVFSEANTQQNPQEDIEKVTAEITGGTFDGGIISEDLVDFIDGGIFVNEPEAEDVKEGESVYRTDEGYVVVNDEELVNQNLEYADDNEDGIYELMPIRIDWNGDFMEDCEDGHVCGWIDFNKEFIADRLADVSIVKIDSSDLKLDASKESGELIGAMDIKIVDRNGNRIPVENSDIDVVIELDEETYNELKAYDKLYAVYFNDNGDEAERIEANLEAEIYNDMPWYYLVFKVSHMSTYGIIGVNDAVAPDTGVITRQGGSATIASAFAAGFVGLLASITSFAYLIKRRKN